MPQTLVRHFVAGLGDSHTAGRYLAPTLFQELNSGTSAASVER